MQHRITIHETETREIERDEGKEDTRPSTTTTTTMKTAFPRTPTAHQRPIAMPGSHAALTSA